MSVRTRFAPSPTGMLHIGGARTALFNYLFAKHNQGEFLLRVEDTDKERSTEEAKQVILEGLSWLGLAHDEEITYQASREKRHQEIVEELLKAGKAYYCYATKEELDAAREAASLAGKRYKYDRRWRDKSASEAPEGVKPVVRLKAPLDGEIIFADLVQGEIKVPNDSQDDFILLRSDGTPTYMLAVVVDDHDMGITHVIRGDDHLANTSKQIMIYEALGWQRPVFAHIPLIYGPDGKKMSKRHGATAVTEYQEIGVLPEAMRNYLLRLGFAHGDDEIISDEQAINWFDFSAVGKSPARFDMKKLDFLNAHYLRETDDTKLLEIISQEYGLLSETEERLIKALLPEIKLRAVNLKDLVSNCLFLRDDFQAKDNLTEKAAKILAKDAGHLEELKSKLNELTDFSHQLVYEELQKYAEIQGVKLKIYAQLIRVALTGSHASPSVFEIMEIFGKDKVLKALNEIV